METEGFFDLLGVHLLARRIDAQRSSSEEYHRAIRLDLGVVAADRIALTPDGAEHLRRPIGILVVAERNGRRHGEQAHLARTGCQGGAVLGQEPGLLPQDEA